MPEEIRKLAKNILKDPVQVTLSLAKPADGITQQAYICHEAQKMGIIKDIFSKESAERVILFVSKKSKVREVSTALRRMGLNVGEMHSDTQGERDEMMFLYKSRKIDLIVATDILARGIDIDDIRIVINYDVPGDCDDYIHRVGRTARANNTGRGITLVSVNDQQAFGRIEKFIGKPIDKIALPAELGEAPEYNPAKKKPEQGKKRSYGSKGRGGKKGDNAQKAKPAKKNEGKAESGNSTAPAPAGQQPMQQSTQAAPSQESAPKKRRRYYGKKKGSGSKPTSTPEAGK